MIKRIKAFTLEEIWRTPLKNKSRYHSFLIRQIRIILLAIRGFLENRVSLRASALTFYTLLSVVPIAAMGFGIAKGFGFESKMEDFIIANFKGQEEVMNWIIDLSYTVLEDVEGGLLAGIGLVVLIWSVMQVLTNIENSFNAIWEVKKSRSFFRKLSDYLAIMLIAPILIVVSSSLSVYISTRIETVTQSMEIIKSFSSYFQSLVTLIPYVLVWLVFTLIYVVMPNTKVNFKYALIAGIIAGTVFQVVQWAYIHFQVGVSKYSALYGTFAALPLFLAWLQISWLIVLLGAEISFAYQNVGKYEFEAEGLNISHSQKSLVSLILMHYIVKKFANGDEPVTSNGINQELGIPLRLVRDTLHNLVEAKVLTETLTANPKESGYQPAIDIARIDISFVIDQIDNVGANEIIAEKSEDFIKLTKMYKELHNSLKLSDSNMLLKDI
jgi:membrane protein